MLTGNAPPGCTQAHRRPEVSERRHQSCPAASGHAGDYEGDARYRLGGEGTPERRRVIQRGHPIIRTCRLPGPMCVTRITDYGVLHNFDDISAYLGEHSDTPDGRGLICRHASPMNVVACASLAAWIWVGGDFPSTIDVVSDAHYRSPAHGRRIRPFNRQIDSQYIITVGGMRVTSPARTACDLALVQIDASDEQLEVGGTIRCLMNRYSFGMAECLAIFNTDSRHWPNIRQARELLTAAVSTPNGRQEPT